MADNIKLVQFAGSSVTPKNDAVLYEKALGKNGIFYGCSVTAPENNILHITGGYGVICGREFEIYEQDISVQLSSGDDLNGRLKLVMDLSNTDEPLVLEAETASTLDPLVQDEDVNYIDGKWEMEMATFTVTTTEIDDLTATYFVIESNAKQIDAINSKMSPLVVFKDYTHAYTLAAGNTLNITGQDFGLSTPSGYSAFGVASFNSGSSFAVPTYVAHNTGSGTAAAVRNVGSSSLNPTFRVRFAYIRNSVV